MNEKEHLQPSFFIDKNGNWFQNGVKIRHRLTYLYNNRLLRRDGETRYFIQEGALKLYVEVEDTPFVVKMVYKKDEDYLLILNDETEEKLDFSTLKIDSKNVPHVRVKNYEFPARFSRPAYYELMKHAKKERNDYYIESKGVRHVLKKS